MSASEKFTAGGELTGMRLDKAAVDFCPELSRAHVQKLLENGIILVNGQSKDKNYRLREGDVVSVGELPLEAPEAKPQDIPLDIVYEDDDVIVVNKPQGMVVHPAPGNPDGTLVNALLYHCKGSLSGINGVLRPGIVHRIDKNTSGLLIVAKNDEAHRKLAAQIKAHSFTRKYEAVVIGRLNGNITEDEGLVDAPIGRSRNDRKKMTVTQTNSKHAVTHYRVLERFRGFTHLELRLETGRTHQIRVHMAYLGHPVAGDDVYGPKNRYGLSGQCLHAKIIGFVHPKTGEYMVFESPLPPYFQEFLRKLARLTVE